MSSTEATTKAERSKRATARSSPWHGEPDETAKREREHIMRKIIATVAALLGVLTLTACGPTYEVGPDYEWETSNGARVTRATAIQQGLGHLIKVECWVPGEGVSFGMSMADADRLLPSSVSCWPTEGY